MLCEFHLNKIKIENKKILGSDNLAEVLNHECPLLTLFLGHLPDPKGI